MEWSYSRGDRQTEDETIKQLAAVGAALLIGGGLLWKGYDLSDLSVAGLGIATIATTIYGIFVKPPSGKKE